MLKIFFLFVAVQTAVCWKRNPGIHSGTLWNAINPSASEKDPGPKESFIYPGTKWCGSGSEIWGKYTEYRKLHLLGCVLNLQLLCSLGRDRGHGSTYRHLFLYLDYRGSSRYFRNHTTCLDCHCDMEFRDCLHKANTTTASGVGGLYFYYLGNQCYKKDHPIVGCKKIQTGIFSNKCLEYELDDTKEAVYQWFDVPNYK